jgi:hypothetical protein
LSNRHEEDHSSLNVTPHVVSEANRELAWVDTASRLLDSKFSIPGTKLTFGFDFLLGLVPGVGDVVSLGFSGVLVATMAKHGASPRLVAKMLLNVGLDALVGTIPLLGNAFDIFFKANNRNAELMRQYYQQGKHSGSAWPVVAMVIGGVGIVIALLIWCLYAGGQWILSIVAA